MAGALERLRLERRVAAVCFALLLLVAAVVQLLRGVDPTDRAGEEAGRPAAVTERAP